jgi:hypothetical protein
MKHLLATLALSLVVRVLSMQLLPPPIWWST